MLQRVSTVLESPANSIRPQMVQAPGAHKRNNLFLPNLVLSAAELLFFFFRRPGLYCKMKLTVTTSDDQIFTLDVASDMELENFMALCEVESGIPISQIVLTHDGRPLQDATKSLAAYQIADGDVLLLIKKPANTAPSSGIDPNDPAAIRQAILADPQQLAQLRISNPPLADALTKSLEEFIRVLQSQKQEQINAREEQERRLRAMAADPFGPEAQSYIAEEIRRQNIEQNMETAMEYHPESYGQVTMLYINCKVNGHLVKAFVDSGAQSTIMSNACAERCSITRLIDTRWSGIAKGVGTQRIIGRIHLCQVQIESDFLASSFTILQDQPMDMLLGLDMLKRHQCSIDLKRNVLVIGTTGTETPFLSESEIPEFAKLKHSDEHEAELSAAIDQSLKSSSTSSSSSSVPPPSFPEPLVQELVSKGFAREKVIEQLRKFNGDKNKALAALLASALVMPPLPGSSK